jgi:hypothetical protein
VRCSEKARAVAAALPGLLKKRETVNYSRMPCSAVATEVVNCGIYFISGIAQTSDRP